MGPEGPLEDSSSAATGMLAGGQALEQPLSGAGAIGRLRRPALATIRALGRGELLRGRSVQDLGRDLTDAIGAQANLEPETTIGSHTELPVGHRAPAVVAAHAHHVAVQVKVDRGIVGHGVEVASTF